MSKQTRQFVASLIDRLILLLSKLRERLVGPKTDEEDLSPIFENMPKPLVQGVTPPLLYDGISFFDGLTSDDPLVRSRFSWKALELFFMGENISLMEVSAAIVNTIPDITPEDMGELMRKAETYKAESEQRNASTEGATLANYSLDFEAEFDAMARRYAELRRQRRITQ